MYVGNITAMQKYVHDICSVYEHNIQAKRLEVTQTDRTALREPTFRPQIGKLLKSQLRPLMKAGRKAVSF